MKKKFIRVMFFGALALATGASFVGCKDYDDDIDNLQQQIDAVKVSLDELQAKMEEVLNYIPVKHLTLCLPDADNLLNSSEEDEVKQWKTVELAKDMAARIFFA